MAVGDKQFVLMESQLGTANGPAQLNSNSVLPILQGGVEAENTQLALANLGAGVQPNLLDNAYFVGGGTGWGVFPVNQIGFTSAGANGVATFDRWRLYRYSSGTVNLTENGVNLNGDFDFGIILEHSRIPETPNLSVTISALTSDGVLITVTGILKNNGQTESFGVPFENGITANLIFIRRWNVPEKDLFFFQLTAPTEVTITAAKLEIGDKQTLAYQDDDGAWQPLPQSDMDYGTQLFRCQRYQIPLDGTARYPIVQIVGANTLLIFIPLPVTMRAAPALSNPDGKLIIYDQIGAAQTGFAFDVAAFCSNGIMLRAQKVNHGITGGFLYVNATTGVDAPLLVANL